jgi:hypothetical protein
MGAAERPGFDRLVAALCAGLVDAVSENSLALGGTVVTRPLADRAQQPDQGDRRPIRWL